jgi:hypothetical protein
MHVTAAGSCVPPINGPRPQSWLEASQSHTVGGREHQQWAGLPQIVTQFLGRGPGGGEPSAAAHDDL